MLVAFYSIALHILHPLWNAGYLTGHAFQKTYQVTAAGVRSERAGYLRFPVGLMPGEMALCADVCGTMSRVYAPLRFPAGLLPDTLYHVEMRTQFAGDTADRLRIEELAWRVTSRAA